MPRLTSKKFIEFVNAQFDKFEMSEWRALKVESARPRPDEIEAGACRLYVEIRNSKYPEDHTHLLCFYTLGQYEKHLKQGYEMYLTMPRGSNSISEMNVEVRKAQPPRKS